MKRLSHSFISLILVSIILLQSGNVLFAGAAAYFTSEEEEILNATLENKLKIVRSAVPSQEYWDGGCADWVSDQLISYGIGFWYKGHYNVGYADGKFWFSDLEADVYTKTGYLQKKYTGEGCLYDLITEYGNFPVYNIVVSFESGPYSKWAASGHVLFILCIYNGNVYYSDVFDQFKYPAGNLICEPLEIFLEKYEKMNGLMLGCVHFEGDEDEHYEPTESVSGIFEITSDTKIYSSPMYEYEGESTAQSDVAKGAKYNISGAYTDAEGKRWYKIYAGLWLDGDCARKVANLSTISATDCTYPVEWPYQLGFTMGGVIQTYGSKIKQVTVEVTNTDGEHFAGGTVYDCGTSFDISVYDRNSYFEHLYYGTCHYYVSVSTEYETRVIIDRDFTIKHLNWDSGWEESITIPREEYKATDCNLDGVIDDRDGNMVFKGMRGQNETAHYYLDVNGDGMINFTDYILTVKSAG